MAQVDPRRRAELRPAPLNRLPTAYAAGLMLACAVLGLGIAALWPKGSGAESGGEPSGAARSPRALLSRQPLDDSSHTSLAPGGSPSRLSGGTGPSVEPAWFRGPKGGQSPRVRRSGSTAESQAPSAAPREEADRQAAEAQATELERAAAQRTAAAETEADTIETTAGRTRERAEAAADVIETRAEAAYSAAEEAFSRGRLTEAELEQARLLLTQARDRAESIRDAAEEAEQRELERAQARRDTAGQAEEQARAQAADLRERGQASRD